MYPFINHNQNDVISKMFWKNLHTLFYTLKCEEVEAALRTTEQSLAKLHKLLDNKPIEYVAMALSGEMQAYCDIEDEMVKSMFGTIVQGYLKKGYNRATAEMMVREFFRYES